MSEKLRGKVTYGRNVPVSSYKTAYFSWEIEFWQDEMTLEQAFADLKGRVDTLLQKTGLFNA